MNYRKLRKILSGTESINTERLVIKNLSLDDADAMYNYAKDPEVSKYLLWGPHINREETRGYLEALQKRYKKGLYGDWGVYIKDGMQLIGTCGYAYIDTQTESCEIGYVLSPEYQNKGYMTEAVKAVLQFTFDEIKARSANLRIMQENKRSEALAKRVGFKLNYIGENEINVKHIDRTLLHYRMTREEYYRLYS